MALRSNSKAKTWVPKKIKQLKREGYEQGQAIAIALNEARKYGLLRNPSEIEELEDEIEDAEELARGFHGRDNKESLELEQSDIYRANTGIIGEMEEIELYNDLIYLEQGLEPIEFSRDVILTGSSNRKQLFLMGDTQLPDDWLEAISPNGWDKDRVILGNAYSISYFTDKHHLEGPKSQKKGAAYGHCFGESSFPNPNAKRNGMMEETIWALEDKLASGLLPEIIYDRLNCRMELVGGGYEIRDEGIWD